MRALAILLVACSSSSPPPLSDLEVAARCPVGDGTHVAVYGFLERELGDGDRATAKQQLARERELVKDKTLKPQRASIVERETSHVLTTLCAGTPGCRAIALYDRGGFARALSTHGDAVAPLGFADDARWSQMRAAPAGTRLDLAAEEARDARGVWVVFPANGGVAACIVDPK